MQGGEAGRTGTSNVETLVFDDTPTLAGVAAARFIDLAATAQERRGFASVALTGGTLGIALLGELARHPRALDWSRVDLYWGDERFVPSGDPQRNSGQAYAALLDHVDVDPARIHVMAPSDGAFGDDIAAATRDYSRLIEAGGPFDLHLLGMGPEGHINSLFPHTATVAEAVAPVVAVVDSPKPPPRRITLTLPVVNRSREVWFLCSGAEKAEAVAAAHHGAPALDWPCAGAHGTEATRWFLDRPAAALL